NLTIIARRYGLTVSQLVRLNKLSAKNVIRKGQRLRVKPYNSDSTSRINRVQGKVAQKSNNGRKVGSRKVTTSGRKHRVRRGETLWDLARNYNVSLSQLARANNIRVNHKVMAGEK